MHAALIFYTRSSSGIMMEIEIQETNKNARNSFIKGWEFDKWSRLVANTV